jgi:hypothetical protein
MPGTIKITTTTTKTNKNPKCNIISIYIHKNEILSSKSKNIYKSPSMVVCNNIMPEFRKQSQEIINSRPAWAM